MGNLFKNKKIRVVSGVIAGIVFLVVIYFVSIQDEPKQNTKQPVSTQVAEGKKEEPKKEDYGIKSTDRTKIKEVKKDGDTLIVSTINETKGNDKNADFLPFRMATTDIIKQVKQNNLDYKTLIIKDYKGDENLFAATFSKNKIDTITDFNFFKIMNYADKIEGYDISKDKLSDKERNENYINGTRNMLGLLKKEKELLDWNIKTFETRNRIDNANTELLKTTLDSVKIAGENVLDDCKRLKSSNAPKEFENIQQDINKACDIYVEVYSPICDKLRNGEIDWVTNNKEKITEANNLIEKSMNELNK